jgi:hypothetical protein
LLIKLLEVNKEYVKTARGGYNKAVVVYEIDGNRKTHNLMDFLNKQVYNTIVTSNPGASFEVTTRQNDKGYAEWAAAEPASAASTSAPTPTGTRTAPTSNYETREERAIRQRLIVRQSSLSAAIATLTPGSKAALNPDEVEALAERYNSFVFAEPKLFDQKNDLEADDIPF